MSIENLQSFSFKVYTKNPITGDTGWDIQHWNAFGVDFAEARQNIKLVPDYVCVITRTASFNGTPLNESDTQAYAHGLMYNRRSPGEVN